VPHHNFTIPITPALTHGSNKIRLKKYRRLIEAVEDEYLLLTVGYMKGGLSQEAFIITSGLIESGCGKM